MKRSLALSFLLLAPVFAQPTASPVVNAMATAGGFGGYAGVAAPGSYVEIYETRAGTSRSWPPATSRGLRRPLSSME